MPGWENWENLLRNEATQAREEGRELPPQNELEAQIEGAKNNPHRATRLLETWADLPIRGDFGFQEPSDLNEIFALTSPQTALSIPAWSDDELLDKLHGAWLGRCAGCALGKPVEGFMGAKGDLSSWQRQKTYLTAISPDEWPLRDYFPAHSPAQEQTGKLWCQPSTREHIAFMESDDDIRYTVLGQIILMEKGRNFTSSDVARAWLRHLPYAFVCTAETQAYRNLATRYEFHQSGQSDEDVDWGWVATHQNPYREWIGAQIRVDSYGYAAPGNPRLAAEFAWRDARISHVKNGIYGAMFCAAMIAASFATNDVRAIIEAGLEQIPTTSRLYVEMQQIIEICARNGNEFSNFEQVFEEIYALLGHYHPVHTNNNAALCVAALLLSGGDFHRGITLAVMGGLDTDCNGATVGSIVGAIAGGQNAPTHWTERLSDTLNSEVIGYHPISIWECARRSLQIARKIGENSLVSGAHE